MSWNLHYNPILKDKICEKKWANGQDSRMADDSVIKFYLMKEYATSW